MPVTPATWEVVAGGAGATLQVQGQPRLQEQGQQNSSVGGSARCRHDLNLIIRAYRGSGSGKLPTDQYTYVVALKQLYAYAHREKQTERIRN